MVFNFSETVRPLSTLRPGERGRIAPGAPLTGRLADLGFVPGTEVTVLRRAPLGDPIEVELRGYRICLRESQLHALPVTLQGAMAIPGLLAAGPNGPGTSQRATHDGAGHGAGEGRA